MVKIYMLFVAIIGIGCTNASSQKTVGKQESAAYKFAVPQGWGTERIPFPIEFAPQIMYKGVEELRFAPGWGVTKSEEYWTYSFLWWLDGNPTINEQVLQEDLKAYYTGLVGRNVTPRSIPPGKVIPVVTQFKKEEGEIYVGTITMTDYMDLLFKPITLNSRITKKNCSGHTALIVAISPQPAAHAVWQSLNKLQADFTCQPR